MTRREKEGDGRRRERERDWLELMRTRRHFAAYAEAPTTVTSFMERAPSSLVPVPGRGRDPKADGNNRVLTSASPLSPLASWKQSSSSSSSSLDTGAKIVNRTGFAYGAPKRRTTCRVLVSLSQSADESGENPP